MLSCFENFIGIDKITTPNAKSELYLTNLGFNLKKMKSGADLPDETALQFTERMLEQAYLFCKNDLLHHIPSVLWNGIIDTQVMPNFSDTYTTYFAGERGITVRKFSNDRFPLRGFRISKIYVKGNDTVNGKIVKIIDGANTVLLPAIDLVAGETYVIDNVDYTVKSEKFSVVMDFTDVQGASPITFLSYCGGCSNWNNIDKYEVQSAYGIALDFTYECRGERIMCQILPYLKYAILYRCGIEILNEFEASDRVNFFAIHKAEWREKNLKLWQEMYEKELKLKLSSISNVVRNIDNGCFSNKRFDITEPIP